MRPEFGMAAASHLMRRVAAGEIPSNPNAPLASP